MRQIIVLTVFAAFCFVPAFGQKEKPAATDTTSVRSEQKGPRFHMPSPEAYRFRIHPKDSLHYRKMPHIRFPGQYPDSLLAEKRSPLDRMPVVRSPGYYRDYYRMPVYKPDTTIDFKLKIKKIERGIYPYRPAK